MYPRQPGAKVLASRVWMGCNAQSFNLKEHPQMHVKRRRLLPNFEHCSVALFASMALYGPLPATAQAASTTAPRMATPRAGAAPSPFAAGAPATQLSAPPSGAIPPNSWTPEQLNDAFKRSDSNGDSRLSREEAAMWSGLSRRFDQIDSNKDGSISSAEFDEALK
jgi:hypothetical protein